MNLLFTLAAHFLLLSLIAVGGASAILPEIHRVLVDSLHLLTSAQFNDLYAISQAAPGPNVLFVSLFGWQIAGFSGAVVSTVAMCAPTCCLSLGVERFGARHRDAKWYVIIRRAFTPISIGLLCSTGLLLVRGATHLSVAVGVAVTTLAILLRFRLNPLWLVGIGAVLGATGIV